jgi:hypothetical protein
MLKRTVLIIFLNLFIIFEHAHAQEDEETETEGEASSEYYQEDEQATAPKVNLPMEKKGNKRGSNEKNPKDQGTRALERSEFDHDLVMKSRYQRNGASLEVDPD